MIIALLYAGFRPGERWRTLHKGLGNTLWIYMSIFLAKTIAMGRLTQSTLKSNQNI